VEMLTLDWWFPLCCLYKHYCCCIMGSCILLRVLSNYKIEPSLATTDVFILCSLQSRHVSAPTSGHLQEILVILNIKIEVTIHYNGSVESNGIHIQ
jgi:hypothetical protein